MTIAINCPATAHNWDWILWNVRRDWSFTFIGAKLTIFQYKQVSELLYELCVRWWWCSRVCCPNKNRWRGINQVRSPLNLDPIIKRGALAHIAARPTTVVAIVPVYYITVDLITAAAGYARRRPLPVRDIKWSSQSRHKNIDDDSKKTHKYTNKVIGENFSIEFLSRLSKTANYDKPIRLVP